MVTYGAKMRRINDTTRATSVNLPLTTSLIVSIVNLDRLINTIYKEQKESN